MTVTRKEYVKSMMEAGFDKRERDAIWEAYTRSVKKKASPRRSPIKNDVGTPRRPLTNRRKSITRESSLRNKDLDADGYPMSPPRNSTPSKIEENPKVVQVTLPFKTAEQLAHNLKLKKLFQVLQASPDLKSSLGLKFWVLTYKKHFGDTQEFMEQKSTDPMVWMNMVETRYESLKKK